MSWPPLGAIGAGTERESVEREKMAHAGERVRCSIVDAFLVAEGEL